MKRILVLGAGHIGSTIADFLGETGDYAITVADQNVGALEALGDVENVETLVADFGDPVSLQSAMAGQYAVLSATVFTLNRGIMDAAAAAGLHYLDLTEDVESSRHLAGLAETADHAMIPQCGLAPGFVSIAAADLARAFDEVHDVRLRVGALPQHPTNALKYNLTWSTEGLINEYLNPCDAIVDGEPAKVMPLEGLEEFTLDGSHYEAFNTSGGLGTLAQSFRGEVKSLNYKTVRYPGHRDIIKLLVDDLRLADRRDLLKEILEAALPATPQDVVLIFISVSGMIGGRLVERSFVRKIYAAEVAGHQRSAIQITTAAGICAVLDLLATGELPSSGLIRQEDIPLSSFLANRFGALYGEDTPDR